MQSTSARQIWEKYVDISFKHQEAISINKYDLGLTKNYKHKIHLKNEDPVYRKQFKILEAHHQFIKQTQAQTGSGAKIGLAIQLPNMFCP